MFSIFPISQGSRTVFTSLVGILTLIGIMTRPFRLNEAIIAMGGATVLGHASCDRYRTGAEIWTGSVSAFFDRENIICPMRRKCSKARKPPPTISLARERAILRMQRACGGRGGRSARFVNAAAEWRADLVLICARARYGREALIGPKSVGHVARFILDHAPCPVFLVRPLAREQFPITR